MAKYGIGTVVGGFGRPMTPEQSIPYAIERTLIEHAQIEFILKTFMREDPEMARHGALEVGCGYGRHLGLLKRKFASVVGVERDEELAAIAREIHPYAHVETGWVGDVVLPNGFFDFALTFTFLQHLNEDEVRAATSVIQGCVRPGGHVLIAEENDPAVTDSTTTARPLKEYAGMFSECRIVTAWPRTVERSFPKAASGAYILFQKQ